MTIWSLLFFNFLYLFIKCDSQFDRGVNFEETSWTFIATKLAEMNFD